MIDLSKLSATPVGRYEEHRIRDLLDEHHYFGGGPKIGETLWHAADDGSGAWPALAAFSAAALKGTAPDHPIGWSPSDRFGRLHLDANNVRLLLRGRQPNLGPRILSLCARPTNADWQARYHHPLLFLEDLLRPERHTSAVYRAANWITVSGTRGYRSHGNGYVAGSTLKQVLVRPLDPDVRARLTAPVLAPELHLHGTEKIRRMNIAEMAGLYDYFTEIDDPRERRYILPTLLSLCAAATARFCRDRGWNQDAGTAINGKTIRGAVDDEGRNTIVLGASSHCTAAQLAQQKPC